MPSVEKGNGNECSQRYQASTRHSLVYLHHQTGSELSQYQRNRDASMPLSGHESCSHRCKQVAIAAA